MPPDPSTAPDPGVAESAPAPEPTAEEPTGPVRLPLTEAEAAELERLLVEADRAIARDHLTYPSAGSALALYDRVRILDPDNEKARRGLERVVERYLELAMNAAEQRRFSQAEAMMDRARLVDPDHPGVAPTQARIDLLDDAERHVIELDPELLRNRDPALDETLLQAGMTSRSDGCRAVITARSDAEGRWIYQQMSGAAGQARIQAELTIGSPPKIEVLCFDR